MRSNSDIVSGGCSLEHSTTQEGLIFLRTYIQRTSPSSWGSPDVPRRSAVYKRSAHHKLVEPLLTYYLGGGGVGASRMDVDPHRPHIAVPNHARSQWPSQRGGREVTAWCVRACVALDEFV
jgi:hypothetical protein